MKNKKQIQFKLKYTLKDSLDFTILKKIFEWSEQIQKKTTKNSKQYNLLYSSKVYGK